MIPSIRPTIGAWPPEKSAGQARPVGLIDRDDDVGVTLEDLGQRYVEERTVAVRDVMTPVIHKVPVTASLSEVARIMVDHHIHRLVVTQRGDPVGIITSMDLLKFIADWP